MTKPDQNGFQQVPIGAFCETGSGGTPSRQKAATYFGGTIPWVKSGELRENVITSTEESITEAGLKESAAKLLPRNTLLVALYGATVGRIGVLGIEAATNQAVCYIIPDERRADRQYLFYALQSQVPLWLSKRVGGGQPNISQGIIKETKIPLPPLPEQKRIADILDKADAIRRKRREAAIEFAQLQSAAFIEHFGDPFANPFAWRMETLDTVVGPKGPGLKRGPFGGALKKEIFVDVGYKVYEQKHAISGDFSLGSYFIDEEKFHEMESFAVQPGDLIVSCSGTMGRVAIVPEGIQPGIINQALLRITPNPDKVSSLYLKLLLETDPIQRHLYGFSRGSGLKNFPPMEEVRALPVPVPSPERLSQFHRYLDRLNAASVNFSKSSEDAEGLFNSLVQRAFRGEL